MKSEPVYSPGLENVIAAETALSDVDGERGHLVIAGHDVEELAPRAGFEEVAAMLWTAAELPERPADVRAALGAARVDAFARIARLGDALATADGMDALRAAIAQLPSRGELAADAVAATGAMAVFAAAWVRGRSGLPPVAPDAGAGHAADYLRMVTGESVSAPRARALDRYLVTVSDHGMNASTFTARVIASTQSDTISAVTGAIGALKGPLHGGAPGPVLDMLDQVERAGAGPATKESGAPGASSAILAGKAERWLEGELAAGRRIMGMGHRVYRVRDPRAAVLERAITELERDLGASTGRLAMARAVEQAATALLRTRYPDRVLAANVEFYTAVVLDAVGLPRTLFAPTFAVSRVAGWTAHVAEQRRTGKLIRPQSRYAPRSA